MNQPAPSTAKHLRVVLGALAVLFGFAILAAILLTRDGGQDARALTAAGDFDEATTEARWKNREEVEAAQAEALDEGKLDKAIESVIASAGDAKPAKTEVVVPGSETFLKQQAAAAKEAPAEAETDPSDQSETSDQPESAEKAAAEEKAGSGAAKKSADKAPAEKKADSGAANEPAEESAEGESGATADQ